MKKIALLGLCCVVSLASVAQENVIKDVERQLKAGAYNFPAAEAAIKPALEHEETKDSPKTWFLIGKGAFDYYDEQEGYKAIGKGVDESKIAHAIMNGYGYLINAMKRDSLPNAKGKIKPKYSKDVIKIIQSHYNDFNTAGANLWYAKDFNGAYEAWELYVTIPFDPVLGANAPAAPHDTIISNIFYNQALAAWQAERYDDALNSFDKALAKGYNKKELYDYAISVAYSMGNTSRMAQYAEMAYPLYGAEDNRYIGYMINDKIANKQFDEAQQMLETYIQADPNNPQLYYVLGVLYDSQEEADKAMVNYKKAIELDPNNAQALLQYGRQICNKAYRLDDSLSGVSTPEYNKARTEQIDPLFREAAQYLEKAYELDPENMDDALRLLRNVYYNLNDQENLQRIESM